MCDNKRSIRKKVKKEKNLIEWNNLYVCELKFWYVSNILVVESFYKIIYKLGRWNCRFRED